MSLMALYQDNGQIEMETSAITFGILKQNTQEHKSMANGEMHDLYSNNITSHNNCANNSWRSLLFKGEK